MGGYNSRVATKRGVASDRGNMVHVIERHFDSFSISFPLSPQSGDSAVIGATVEHESDVLRVLVDAGSDLNVQNEVRYTVTVASAAGVIPSCPY